MTVDPHLALDRTVALLQDYVESPDADIVNALTTFRVALAADEQTLATASGRAALLTTFDCVARLGVQLVLEIPQITIPLPPGFMDSDAQTALLERSGRLITQATSDGDADLRLVLGGEIESGAIALGGTNTAGRLRIGEPAGGWEGELPLGAALAAAAAGAEVARAVITRLLNGKKARTPLSIAHQPVDLSLPPLAVEGDLDLGQVDFVSAGAITNAVLFLLFQIDRARLQGRVFDDDTAHVDNLNRYFLLTASDLEQPKVQHLESLNTQDIVLEGVERRIDDDPGRDVNTLADTVCTGVDWVEGRWAAQAISPDWHGVGATSHTYAAASEHWPRQACAACIHPVRGEHLQRMPTISFVSLLAGTLMTHRLIQHLVAPIGVSERTEVLDALNLSSTHTVISDRPSPNPACRLNPTEHAPASM